MTPAKRLYIISDLHLGGDYPTSSEVSGRGFRICTHVRELAEFVRSVAFASRRTDTELVINGDLVDFLAEKSEVREPISGESSFGWQPLIETPSEALKVFRRIID